MAAIDKILARERLADFLAGNDISICVYPDGIVVAKAAGSGMAVHIDDVADCRPVESAVLMILGAAGVKLDGLDIPEE